MCVGCPPLTRGCCAMVNVVEFSTFLSELFPTDAKRSMSGEFYKAFGDKLIDIIKNTASAAKHLHFLVKQLQLVDLPSLDAPDVLVVPVSNNLKRYYSFLNYSMFSSEQVSKWVRYNSAVTN